MAQAIRYATEEQLKDCGERCGCGNSSSIEMICYNACSLPYSESDSEWTGRELYKVFRCPACHAVTIVEYSWGMSEDMVDPYDPYCDWIRRVLYSAAEPRLDDVPPRLSQKLGEARSIVDSSPQAAVILGRAIIEEMCRDRGINEYNLKEKIKKLLVQEALEEPYKEALEALREVGNGVVHGDFYLVFDVVRSEDAETMLNAVEKVLLRVYDQREEQARQAARELGDILKALKE